VSTIRCLTFVCILALLNQNGPSDSRSQEPDKATTAAIASKIACADGPNAKALPPPGPACEKEQFARHGRPFMFPPHSGIAYGVSAAPGKESALYLWADNQTGDAVSLLFCCVTTLFEQIDIFDSEGHRLLSKRDLAEQKARSDHRQTVDVCSCSGWSSVPPHTVQLFVFADVSEGYSLKPGRYTISERYPAASYNLSPDERDSAPRSRPGLSISIP